MVRWSRLGRRAAAADKIILHIFIQMLPGEESKHKIFLVSLPDYFLEELQTTEQQRGHIIIMTLIILLHLANTAVVGTGVNIPSFPRTRVYIIVVTILWTPTSQSQGGRVNIYSARLAARLYPRQPVREEKWAAEKILTLPCFCFCPSITSARHRRPGDTLGREMSLNINPDPVLQTPRGWGCVWLGFSM